MPPRISPSRLIQAVKGKTSHHLMRESHAMRRAFGGRHVWGRGYFVCSSGNITDEAIAQYIATQNVEPNEDEDFRVESG